MNIYHHDTTIIPHIIFPAGSVTEFVVVVTYILYLFTAVGIIQILSNLHVFPGIISTADIIIVIC